MRPAVVGPKLPVAIAGGGLSPGRHNRPGGSSCSQAAARPLSSRSFSLAWAMSRATTIVPVSDSRVFTGYRDKLHLLSRPSGRFRSIAHRSRRPTASRSPQAGTCRVGLQAAPGTHPRGNLRQDLPVGAARHADADWQRGTVPGQPHHTNVMAEIFAAELRADAAVAGQSPGPVVPAPVSRNAWPALLPLVGKPVQPLRRGQLHRLQRQLGRRARR